MGGYVDSYIFVFAFTGGLGVLGIVYSTFVLKECFGVFLIGFDRIATN